MLEDQMFRTDGYWAAYRRLKKLGPITGVDADNRLSREELRERRR